MNRALAVVRGSERTKALIREAGRLAGGVDAELILLHVTDEEAFEEQAAALAGIPDFDVTYSVENARDGARQYAEDVGTDVLADLDVDWRAVGALGDDREEVLRAATAYDVDHLFLAGRKRSPAGKAIFGDLAQDVILEFDGPVTILTE